MTDKTAIALWMEDAIQKYTPLQIVEKLRLSGWNDVDILKLISQYGIKEIPKKLKDPINYPDVKNPEGKNKIRILDQEYNILFESKSPRVVLIEDFITLAESAEMVNKAKERIARSTVMKVNVHGDEVSAARTSEGMFYLKEEFDALANVERRIEALTNWPIENQEAMQILRYGIGAEYVAHNDYFNEEDPGVIPTLQRGGNRSATVILYLNDVDSGGGTYFPESTIEVKPKARSALFFGYPTTDSRSKTLHAGLPVIAGEKWIAVKWIRESIFS